MKHVKTVSKMAGPARAFVWDWFINFKTLTPGLINNGKGWYVNALWASDDSLDPTDINDLGGF